MNLLGTPADDDLTARKITDEISRVNRAMADHPSPQWVDVQVGYRVTGSDYFREDVMRQQAPEVPELLARLVRHVKLAYGQMTVDTIRPEGYLRLVTFDIADLLYVDVQSSPHEPLHTDEDDRRRNLRLGGRALSNRMADITPELTAKDRAGSPTLDDA